MIGLYLGERDKHKAVLARIFSRYHIWCTSHSCCQTKNIAPL